MAILWEVCCNKQSYKIIDRGNYLTGRHKTFIRQRLSSQAGVQFVNNLFSFANHAAMPNPFKPCTDEFMAHNWNSLLGPNKWFGYPTLVGPTLQQWVRVIKLGMNGNLYVWLRACCTEWIQHFSRMFFSDYRQAKYFVNIPYKKVALTYTR